MWKAKTLAMGFKLAQSAEKRWRKFKDFEILGEVIIIGEVFKDGKPVTEQSNRICCLLAHTLGLTMAK